MNEVMTEKYKKLLNTFERVILNTKDEELKESSKKSYVTFIYELAILEHEDLNIYEEKMKSLNIPEEVIKNTIDNIEKTQSKETKSDENIDKVELPNSDKTIDETLENNNEEEKIEKTQEESIEEYIFINVYRNKDSKIGDEYQKIVLKLQEDLKKTNDKLIKTWINNYISFANHYKNELDKDKLIEYMYELFKKFDKENKYIDKLPKFIEEIEYKSTEKDTNKEEASTKSEAIEESKIDEKNTKEEKPLKIINIKKSFKSKKELAVLGTTALIGVGGAVLGAPGLLVLPLAAIIHKLYKSKGLTNNRLKNFLKHNNYTLDEETKELKDNNGEVITEDKIGKAKYEMLKQYLLKLDSKKQDGEIKTEYKKNKMASKLLNTKFVEKLKNIKKNNQKETIEFEELEENQEIQKGMGKC